MFGKAWSVFGKPVEITVQDSCVLYDNQAVYETFGGVVLAKEEGENIAAALGHKRKTCILQNHGLLTREIALLPPFFTLRLNLCAVGSTVDEAAALFNKLDRYCHVMLMTSSAGHALQPTVTSKEEAEYSAKLLQDPHFTYASVSDWATFTSRLL